MKETRRPWHEQDEQVFSLRLYCAMELRRLLEDCGFRGVAVYGGLSRAPYDDKAERLVVRGASGLHGLDEGRMRAI